MFKTESIITSAISRSRRLIYHLKTATNATPLHCIVIGCFMSDSKSASSSGGSGVIGLLGVVFVTLKLCGVINWSWWWVTAPFWGGFAILLAILGIIVLVAGGVFVFEKITSR